MSEDKMHDPRPFCDWHDGDVLWWRIPISEPPYVGSPLDMGFAVKVGLTNQFGDEIGTMTHHVGGWPFSKNDEHRLWWTPLPDAKRIEDQVPF